MKNRYLESFEAAQIGAKVVPSFRAGDTVKIGVEIIEGNKSRVQAFEGTIIAIRGNGVDRTFTT